MPWLLYFPFFLIFDSIISFVHSILIKNYLYNVFAVKLFILFFFYLAKFPFQNFGWHEFYFEHVSQSQSAQQSILRNIVPSCLPTIKAFEFFLNKHLVFNNSKYYLLTQSSDLENMRFLLVAFLVVVAFAGNF